MEQLKEEDAVSDIEMEGDSEEEKDLVASDEERQKEDEYDTFKTTGELDLPEDNESEEESDENEEVSDDDRLDDYYRELGIEPETMQTKRAKTSKSEAVYKTTKKVKES